MTNKEELKKDIERARKTQKSIEYFRNKYTRFHGCDLRRIADVLEIAEQYDIPCGTGAFQCQAKTKLVNIEIPRPFCGLFELKRRNNDV